MDDYIELAKQYLLRKESKRRDCMKLICNPDYKDIDSKWNDEIG